MDDYKYKSNAEFKTSACEQYEAALEDRLNGDLGGMEAADLTEHLKNCSGCASALEEAQMSARLLRVAEPTADPGAGFARIAMARIRGEMENRDERSIWRPFVSLAWKLSGAAALVLVLLVTFDVRLHRGSEAQIRDEVAIVAANEAPELLSDEARLPTNRDEMLILMADDSKHAKH